MSGLDPKFYDPDTKPFFDEHYRSWHVFKDKDVRRVGQEFKTFEVTPLDKSLHPFYASFGGYEQPQHRHARAIVQPAFTKRGVAPLEDSIRTIFRTLLDDFVAEGHTDIIKYLGGPYPLHVTCQFMGLPLSDADRLGRWTEELGMMKDAHNPPSQPDAIAYFSEALAEARERPKDDTVVSMVAHGRMNGEVCSEFHQIGDLMLLLAGGAETTTHLVSNALLLFDKFGVMEEVRANRKLIPDALEEVLRWYPPFPMIRRRAAHTTEIGGVTVEEGQSVTAWLPAANRDPDRHPDPNSFNIHRSPNDHVTFGFGAHFCIGAPLARMEGRIAINEILDRFETIRIDYDKPIVSRVTIIDALTELHVSYRAKEMAA